MKGKKEIKKHIAKQLNDIEQHIVNNNVSQSAFLYLEGFRMGLENLQAYLFDEEIDDYKVLNLTEEV
jgi:hypothetical protein